MKCINMVILAGYVVTDPIISAEDSFIVKFRIVTNKHHFSKKKGEYVVTSEYHTIKCFKGNATFALENLKKKSEVFLQGEIHYHHYTTADGKRGTNSEITVTSLSQLDKDITVPKSTNDV